MSLSCTTFVATTRIISPAQVPSRAVPHAARVLPGGGGFARRRLRGRAVVTGRALAAVSFRQCGGPIDCCMYFAYASALASAPPGR
eukprot:364757-Chlamydomonas_euryale.AAC.11